MQNPKTDLQATSAASRAGTALGLPAKLGEESEPASITSIKHKVKKKINEHETNQNPAPISPLAIRDRCRNGACGHRQTPGQDREKIGEKQ